MKKMRKLIPAFAMLMVAAIMMTTASFAWFSMSTTAEANGMQVKATASSSLVITNSPELNAFLVAGSAVNFEAANNSLTPATHDASFANGLKAPTNTGTMVDVATGAVKDDATYKDAPAGSWVDYTVYIGAAGGQLTGNLVVTMENETLAANQKVLHNALTIDFYVFENATVGAASTDIGAYKGSINVATCTAAASKVTLTTGIPQAVLDSDEGQTAGTCVKVTMRVYFDGALEDTTTTQVTDDTFVRNALVTAEDVLVGVNFAME